MFLSLLDGCFKKTLRFAWYDRAVVLTVVTDLSVAPDMALYLLDECECCLHAFHVFNGDYAASVALAYFALELACGDVAHYATE